MAFAFLYLVVELSNVGFELVGVEADIGELIVGALKSCVVAGDGGALCVAVELKLGVFDGFFEGTVCLARLKATGKLGGELHAYALIVVPITLSFGVVWEAHFIWD